jgi:transposase-like protein
MKKISYAGYRFPPEIIHQAIWLYLRFTLSFRDDVVNLTAARTRAARHTVSRATPYAASARHSANAIERRCL